MYQKRKKVRRLTSLLLALLLCCSLAVPAFAASDTEEQEEEKSPLECWADRVEFLEDQPSALPVEYIVPQSQEVQDQMGMISLFSTGDHSYNNMAIHVIAQIRLDHPFAMPNGSMREEMDCFAMDMNHNGRFSLSERTYCLDPYTGITGGAHYDSVETPAASNVASPWGRLTAAQQRAVGLALLYGHGSDVGYLDSDNEIYDQIATQLVVHEILLGYRETTAPYKCTNPIYINSLMSGAVFTRGIWVDNGWVGGRLASWELNRIKSTYDGISNHMAAHTTPSFASGRPQLAPTYTMDPISGGRYQVTLTDTKNVLFNCTMPSISGLHFSKSGNRLTITADSYGSIPTTTIMGTVGTRPNPERSAYLVWSGTPASGNTQDQICVKAGGVKKDPVPAYFKLKAVPYGQMAIQKRTDDGGHLSGWKFEIRKAGGSLLGTYSTGADGRAVVPNLLAGSYTVKEVGNQDGGLTAAYQCTSTNPQSVNISAGSTSTVTFQNRQIAHIKITKKMATDGPIEGWRFKITDSRGEEVAGSPFTSDSNGNITAWNLSPGQYTVRELIDADSAYYCKTENPVTVTATAGQTAAVSFTNTLKPGSIQLNKVDLNGQSLVGAKFCLEWSEDGNSYSPVSYSPSEDVVKGGCRNSSLEDGCLTTGEDGKVMFGTLYPGLYYRITEVEAPEGYQLLKDSVWEGVLNDTLDLSFRVVNAPTFMLPATGMNGFWNLPAILTALTGAFFITIYYFRKKD